MKREQLKELGLEDAAIDKVMALNGADIEKQKAALDTAKTEADALKAQLAEANTAIEGFKKLDVDGIKAAADEYKTKYEQAQAESAAALLKVKQEHALERELKETFKVADLVAVKAHLKADGIKFNDKDETFVGLKEQLDPLKESHGAYFLDQKPTPQITAGGQPPQSGAIFTVDQIKQMSTKEINANWTAVQETLSKGK